jgi:fructokinase
MPRETNGPFGVSIGEGLFDRFPIGADGGSGRAVLGGAPVNFAVHLASLIRPAGGQSAVITRVGTDELGDRLIAEARARDVDVSLIQRDDSLPTGTADVGLDKDGEPRFDIRAPAAWDRIEASEPALDRVSGARLVLFGTLGQRDPVARDATAHLVERARAAGATALFDPNLRGVPNERELVGDGLRRATALKVNQRELTTVASWVGVDDGPTRDTCRGLMDRCGLELLILTRGCDGTVLHTREHAVEGKPASFEPHPDADPVGAGDACAATVAAGLLLGVPLDRVADAANAVGAFVASRRGAVPVLPEALASGVSG